MYDALCVWWRGHRRRGRRDGVRREGVICVENEREKRAKVNKREGGMEGERKRIQVRSED